MLSHMLLSLSARHAQFVGMPQGLSSRLAGPGLPPADHDFTGKWRDNHKDMGGSLILLTSSNIPIIRTCKPHAPKEKLFLRASPPQFFTASLWLYEETNRFEAGRFAIQIQRGVSVYLASGAAITGGGGVPLWFYCAVGICV